MDIINDKYYKGFEGEPEIRFIRISDNGSRTSLSMWEGYLDKIIETTKPESTGWTGLTLYYHLHEGWYEKSPWQIPDNKEVIDQLQKIQDNISDYDTKNVCNDIKEFLLEAESKKQIIQIHYL